MNIKRVVNNIDRYSDKATYTPNSISGAIVTDNQHQIAYVVVEPSNETVAETLEEFPLYVKDNDGNFTFYAYDNTNRVQSTLFVKAEALTDIETTTFELAEMVAENKTEYSYDNYGNILNSKKYSYSCSTR